MTEEQAQISNPVETVQVAYPSVLAPGLPAFTMDAPVGWNVGEFPGALLAAAAPEIEGQFRPNIVVQGRRVPDTYTLAQAADEAVAELQAIYGEVASGERQVSTDDGAELLQQALGYRMPEDGPALGHLNVLVLMHDEIAPGGFRSLLGINAVCAQEQADEYLPIFRSIITSFHVERRVLDLGDGTSD